MATQIHDPITGYHLNLERDGENLVVDTRVDPGGKTPPHIHPNQEERFTIHTGKVRFQVGRKKVVVGPGDELVVPAGTNHGFHNIGSEEAHFVAYVTPALDLEGFFIDTAAASAEGLYTRRGIPKSLRGAVWAAHLLDRYSDEVIITNPPRFLQRVFLSPLRRLERPELAPPTASG